MNRIGLFLMLFTALTCGCKSFKTLPAKTNVGIRGDQWVINGESVHKGSPAEGLLMNVRMVNAVFEDVGPAAKSKLPDDFNPEANTSRFIQAMPGYYARGVRAFTISLQGGLPGYEGAINTAFHADGNLKEAYMSRVGRVIHAANQHGLVIILSCFYQRQHSHSDALTGKPAIVSAVRNVARWIKEEGFTNVVLEISNEYAHRGFDRWKDGERLRSVEGQAELIREAKTAAPSLLVSTSGMGNGQVPEEIARAADFVTLHFNNTPLYLIPERIREARKFGKPVICNEDDKVGDSGAEAARLSVKAGAGWGFMHIEKNQTIPFRFDGAADDTVVYAMLSLLTRQGESIDDIPSAEYFPPPDSLGGWRTLTDPKTIREVAGMDRDALEEAFNFARTTSVNGGLLVVRHGYLVYEKYFGKGQRNATPNQGSCGKSFTSIAVGMLMEEQPDRFPEGLDQKIFTRQYLPETAFPLPDARMKDIKLGQLLSFSAGIRGNNPVYVNRVPSAIDPAGPDGWPALVDEYALGVKEGLHFKEPFSTASLWCAPGSGYSYATASIHIASIMLRQVAGMELEDFVRTRLATPLGWGRWGFGYKHAEGVHHTPGGGGIALRSTDMLRFCYMLLHEGRWNGKQIVPAEYIGHASKESPYNPHFPYSLQFNVNTRGDVATLPRDAYWKSGSGGHCLYVVPSLDLIIWKLGGRDAQYSTRDTGLPQPPPLPNPIPRIDDGKTHPTPEDYVRTLEMVIRAVTK